MAVTISVKFRNAAKLYDFDPLEETFEHGDMVIVETARGREMATVVAGNREVPDEELKQPLKPIIRRATDEDAMRADENRSKEPEAYRICKVKIAEHQLDMKLVAAEYTYDGSKLLFYFTSDDRVDFRELVKDLAATFRTRIELRQIGVRDEAKIQGGIGGCGRPLCCSTFLPDFVPVSIKMAKEQNLSLNPTKISGICGRLMCCLKNEQETYEYLNSTMPRNGDTVVHKTEHVKGVVQDTNVLRQRVKVLVEVDADTNELREYPVEELEFRRSNKKNEEVVSDEDLAFLERLEELDKQNVIKDEVTEPERPRRERREPKVKREQNNNQAPKFEKQPAESENKPDGDKKREGGHHHGHRGGKNHHRKGPNPNKENAAN
ncbi:MAG: stage 0 sporulation family protein [Lachnospiraceae bacterium]|nr:stage 0 sporulation family protein [Candidatus Minthocola equi]